MIKAAALDSGNNQIRTKNATSALQVDLKTQDMAIGTTLALMINIATLSPPEMLITGPLWCSMHRC